MSDLLFPLLDMSLLESIYLGKLSCNIEAYGSKKMLSLSS